MRKKQQRHLTNPFVISSNNWSSILVTIVSSIQAYCDSLHTTDRLSFFSLEKKLPSGLILNCFYSTRHTMVSIDDDVNFIFCSTYLLSIWIGLIILFCSLSNLFDMKSNMEMLRFNFIPLSEPLIDWTSVCFACTFFE